MTEQNPFSRTDKLKLKEFWTLENSEQIAEALGVPHDERFIKNLPRIIEELIIPASIMDFASIMAIRFLKESK